MRVAFVLILIGRDMTAENLIRGMTETTRVYLKAKFDLKCRLTLQKLLSFWFAIFFLVPVKISKNSWGAK